MNCPASDFLLTQCVIANTSKLFTFWKYTPYLKIIEGLNHVTCNKSGKYTAMGVLFWMFWVNQECEVGQNLKLK